MISAVYHQPLLSFVTVQRLPFPLAAFVLEYRVLDLFSAYMRNDNSKRTPIKKRERICVRLKNKLMQNEGKTEDPILRSKNRSPKTNAAFDLFIVWLISKYDKLYCSIPSQSI